MYARARARRTYCSSLGRGARARRSIHKVRAILLASYYSGAREEGRGCARHRHREGGGGGGGGGSTYTIECVPWTRLTPEIQHGAVGCVQQHGCLERRASGFPRLEPRGEALPPRGAVGSPQVKKETEIILSIKRCAIGLNWFVCDTLQPRIKSRSWFRSTSNICFQFGGSSEQSCDVARRASVCEKNRLKQDWSHAHKIHLIGYYWALCGRNASWVLQTSDVIKNNN